MLAWWNWWLLPIPVVAFIALIVYHERVARSANSERRAAAYYDRGLARLDGRWAGSGEMGERFRDPIHPYADDLDLFGQGSVFQLLNTARTHAGEATLAGWLKQAATGDEVRSRQEAVDEMRPSLDLREDLALLGEDIQAALHPAALVKWGDHAAEDIAPWMRFLASLLTAVTLGAFTGYMFQLWPPRVLILALVVQSGFALYVRATVLRILASVELPARDLGILSKLLDRFEREPFHSPKLSSLKAQLQTDGQPASRRIAGLHRIIEMHDSGRNPGFAPFAKALLWSTHFAFALESWRSKSGKRVSVWLEVVAELEALSSLAAYAAEHPDDVYPELMDTGPSLHAQALAHPLLGPSAVANDVTLGSDLRLLLVSGSNMSGKSTLLRSVGLNTVLAWTGAPVRARRLQVSRLAVGASIRVNDSLQDGKSRFYAEITRLRQIVDMLHGSDPLLFLLDEVLSGTNSHDRRIGADAIIRTLVEEGGIGLVTTHDLALTAVAQELGQLARNVHFEDHIEDGRIAFDYRMRPGVVEKSNALELMRSVGLRV